MEVTEPTFNRPIPGEGLTHELGARPWQNPPQFSTVDETVSYYVARIGQDEFAKGLINVIEMGVPLTVLANTIQLAGVMEGKHSVDVGILIMPALIEAMSLIADSAGVEYDTGMKEESMLPNQLAQRMQQICLRRMKHLLWKSLFRKKCRSCKSRRLKAVLCRGERMPFANLGNLLGI